MSYLICQINHPSTKREGESPQFYVYIGRTPPHPRNVKIDPLAKKSLRLGGSKAKKSD